MKTGVEFKNLGIVSSKHANELIGKGFQSNVWEPKRKSQERPVVFKTATLAWRLSCLVAFEPDFLEKRNQISLELVKKYFPDHLVPTHFRQVTAGTRSVIVQERIPQLIELTCENNPSDEVMESLAQLAQASQRMYQETGYILDFLGSGILHGMPRRLKTDPNYWALPNLVILGGNRVGIMDFCLFQLKSPTNIMDRAVRVVYYPYIMEMQKRLGLKFHD
ncbi:MAG: hypothetical protein BroJett025_03790 [Patescibacteria group bacterium]|nr:MAG: hypothetical protein BroJett025_03790 [Patescibacteria group bacterium]